MYTYVYCKGEYIQPYATGTCIHIYACEYLPLPPKYTMASGAARAHAYKNTPLTTEITSAQAEILITMFCNVEATHAGRHTRTGTTPQRLYIMSSTVLAETFLRLSCTQIEGCISGCVGYKISS
jgi:hypothetical protein